MRWILGGLMLLSMHAMAGEPAPLRVAGAVWCPYNCMVDGKPDKRGFMFDMLDVITHQQGRHWEYAEFPWRRAIVATRGLQADLLSGALKTDTPDFLFGKQPFGMSRSCFVTRTSSQWQYRSVADLQYLRLAVLTDQTFGEPVDKFIRDPRHKQQITFAGGSDYLPKNMEALAHDWVDATLDDEYVLRYWLNQTKREAEFRFAGCLQSGGVYLAVPPKHPQAKALLQMLDHGVSQLRDSGELAHILAKYGLTDWQQP